MLQPHEQDWWDAWRLQQSFDQGVQPQPLPAPVPLEPGEYCYTVDPCDIQRFQGVRLAFGSSQGHAAAAQWRTIDHGSAVLTQHRVLMLGQAGPQTFGLAAVTRMWTEHDGVVLAYGEDQYKVRTGRPVWFDVLLNQVAFRRRLELAVPPYVLAAWRRAGLIA